MKNISFLIAVLILLLSGCRSTSDSTQILEELQENLDFGNLTAVVQIADSLKQVTGEDLEILHISDSLRQIAERINLDFSVNESKFNTQIERIIGHVSPGEIKEWEDKGWLEWRIIDGEKKYFNRAASNLSLLRTFYEKSGNRERKINPELLDRLKHTEKVLESAGKNEPAKMRITYTISVHPGTVPDGEKIRCWLPWPREDIKSQKEIKLLASSNPEYFISPDSSIHSTIYMEETAKKDLPSIFRVSYEYVSFARHLGVSEIKILPYRKESFEYQKYTSEHFPHICFTDNLKQLTDSLTEGIDDPLLIVRKVYMWFKKNIPWAGALEYSTIPNIPEYVLKYRRGDCGMQTFLLISMLRYKGIPARWQSGWMMAQGYENLHDWCEVYYEGTGWVPVDVTFDLQDSGNNSLKEFFLTGLDSYRLIVNSDIAGPLHPEKLHLRSEPYDFQRGEVEWKGGNLYFDKWDYNMNIEYLK